MSWNDPSVIGPDGEHDSGHPAASTNVWVFDVDGTIIDSLTGTSLRPGTTQLLATLLAQDCALLLWSAGGGDYARRRAIEHGVVAFFSGFYSKRRDERGWYTASFLADSGSATFVDDRREDLPSDWHVRTVTPYVAHDPHDTALSKVLPVGSARQHQTGQR